MAELAFDRDGVQYLLRQHADDSWEWVETRMRDVPDYRELRSRLLHGCSGAHVVVNTMSGKLMSRQFYNQVLQPLLELLQVASSVVFTRTAEEYVQWLQEQGDALFDRVLVAVGGDAVLHETANHVMRSAARARPLHLFVVPCGSGNALASSCGIRAPSDALQRLASPRGYRALPTLQARLCSAGRDSVIAGVVVVSWALHAALVADSDTEELRRQYGNERFAVAARQNLAEPYVYRGRVTAYKDGTATVYGDEGQVYLLLSRCSHLEPGYCILPAADPLAADVRIHGIRIPAIADGARIGEILMRGYSDAGHVSDESVQVLDADRVEFSVNEPAPLRRRVCIDGKIYIVDQDTTVTVTCSNELGLLMFA